MMKKVIAGILTLALALSFVGCGNKDQGETDEKNAQQQEETKDKKDKEAEKSAERDDISQKAVDIALKDAGLKEADVKSVMVKPEDKDGQPIHEVKFYQDYKSFEYEIADADGAILSKEIEEGEKATEVANASVNVEDAEKAARDAANIPDDAVLVSSETDEEDGTYTYKFASNDGVHKITVDYNSKSIIKSEHKAN